MRPVKELEPLSLLVNVALVLLSVNVPLPVSDETVCAKPAKSTVPDALINKEFVDSKAFVTPLVKVPPVTVVVPIFVLATLSVNTPAPVLVRLLPDAPLIAVVVSVIFAGPAPLVSIVSAIPPWQCRRLR